MTKLPPAAWLLITFTTLLGFAFGNPYVGAAVGVGLVLLANIFA